MFSFSFTWSVLEFSEVFWGITKFLEFLVEMNSWRSDVVTQFVRFKGIPRKILQCFKEVSRVFQKSFKSVLRKFHGCFKEVFQGSLKAV